MRLLLETHLSAVVAAHLQQRGIDAVTLQDWQGGVYRTASDETILAAAYAEGRIFVTRDVKTVPALLKILAEEGKHHAGVLLVPSRSFPQSDIGRLVRALVQATAGRGDLAWEDMMDYLLPAE
jgi:predicted nuclease of predicted toxin-antitoxin system